MSGNIFLEMEKANEYNLWKEKKYLILPVCVGANQTGSTLQNPSILQ